MTSTSNLHILRDILTIHKQPGNLLNQLEDHLGPNHGPYLQTSRGLPFLQIINHQGYTWARFAISVYQVRYFNIDTQQLSEPVASSDAFHLFYQLNLAIIAIPFNHTCLYKWDTFIPTKKDLATEYRLIEMGNINRYLVDQRGHFIIDFLLQQRPDYITLVLRWPYLTGTTCPRQIPVPGFDNAVKTDPVYSYLLTSMEHMPVNQRQHLIDSICQRRDFLGCLGVQPPTPEQADNIAPDLLKLYQHLARYSQFPKIRQEFTKYSRIPVVPKNPIMLTEELTKLKPSM